MDTFKYVQTQAMTLYGAGASIGDTSLRVVGFNDLNGTALTITDFGSKGFGTIEPGTTDQEEPITFTGVTNNGDGTSTLTGIKTQLGKAPYTETSGLAITHAGGTTFALSNTAGFYDALSGKGNDETVTGVWTFTAPNYPLIDTPATPPTADGQFTPKKYVDDLIAAGAPKATNTVYGISKLSVAAASAAAPIAVGDNDNRVSPVSLAAVTADKVAALAGTGTPNGTTGKYVTNDDTTGTGVIRRSSVTDAQVKFGGTGADGALTISSGTTTIDLTGLSIFVKNYTSISITGTGALAFSNPAAGGTIIILKSKGDVDITSSANPVINLKNTGAAAVTQGFSTLFGATNNGVSQAGTSGGAGGVGKGFTKTIYTKIIPISTGSGGGNGSVSGGAGGGALLIECGGAYNFTTGTIDASGTIGATSGSGNVAGGGGGAGGSVVVIYNTLTANTGTYSLNGGNGGAPLNSPTVGGGGGGGNRVSGGGGAQNNSNTGLSAGANDDGTGGTVTNTGGNGGGGAGGYKLIIQNTEFA